MTSILRALILSAMGTLRGGTRAAAICVAALAVVAPIAVGGSPDRSVETEDEVFGAGDFDSVQTKCDQGDEVTGGGMSFDVGTNFGGAIVDGLYPKGDNSFRLEARNFEGAEVDVDGFAVCFRGESFKREKRTITLPGGGDVSATVKAKCPRGTSVVGGGVDVEPFDLRGSGAVEVFSSRPLGNRKWLGRVYVEQTPRDVTVYAICDKDHEYETVTRVAVGEPGRRTNVDVATATPRCAQGDISTNAGWELDDSVSVSALHDVVPTSDREWLVRARFLAQVDPEFKAYVVCRTGD